ncbi:hypothetical protein ACKS0A_06724 [Histoplasma ohiense]
MPCHANFPIFAPHAELGHVRRPESGASGVYLCSSAELCVGDELVCSGKREGRIHVSGCKNM